MKVVIMQVIKVRPKNRDKPLARPVLKAAEERRFRAWANPMIFQFQPASVRKRDPCNVYCLGSCVGAQARGIARRGTDRSAIVARLMS